MNSLYERVVPPAAQLLHEGIFDPHILKAIFTGGGMGCIAGHTRLFDPRTGRRDRVDVLAETALGPITVLALAPSGFEPVECDPPFVKGMAELYEVEMEDGYSVTVTDEHRFLTPDGWRSLGELRHSPGQQLAAFGGRPASRSSASPSVRPEDVLHSTRRAEDSTERCSAIAVSSCNYHSKWKGVRAIRSVGEGVYYDLTVPRWANYVAEGLVHHNSGKSFVAGMLFGKAGKSFGLKSLSVDEIFEMRAGKTGLDPKTAFRVPTKNPDFASKGHEVHDAAWYTMMNQRAHASRGRLGLLIDGTAKDPAYILRGKKALEALGYDCSMVMVATPLKIARERNQARGRSVTDADLKASHDAIRRAGNTYKKKFGKRYYEIENIGPYDVTSREFRAETEPAFHRYAMKILAKPLTNPKGKAWVTQQLEGAPAHLKKKVWQGLGIRWKPSAVDRLGALGRRALKTRR